MVTFSFNRETSVDTEGGSVAVQVVVEKYV
jgi:hypothetical protein